MQSIYPSANTNTDITAAQAKEETWQEHVNKSNDNDNLSYINWRIYTF